MFDSPEVRFALEVVRQAARLVRQVQAEMVSPALTKSDRSPVTVADFTAQAVISKRLEQSFPADPLVGEEDAATLRTDAARETLEQVARYVARALPEATPANVCDWIDRGAADTAARYWTLDPIDGTKGFLRKDQYAVALALVDQGRVTVGVLGCPDLADAGKPARGGPGSLVVGAAGQGAWVTPLEGPEHFVRLAVSDRRDPRQARLLRSFESGHTNTDKMSQLAAAFGAEAEPVLMDSLAKYAVLAAGQGDVMFRLLSADRPNYREKIWDQAAGVVIIEEAGGRVTDLDGKPLDFTAGRQLEHNRGVLASNRHLHEAALRALRQVSA